MGWVWDLRQARKDSTALCKILNLEKILEDNRQDPIQSYKTLQEFFGILISSGKDPTVL